MVCSAYGRDGFAVSRPSERAGAPWVLCLSNRAAFPSRRYCGKLLCDHVFGSVLIPVAQVLVLGGRNMGSQSIVAGKCVLSSWKQSALRYRVV